jgi:PD-(D/E)XK nuclease superfamily protein
MTRKTIVVPSRLAWHEERFRAAEQNALGLQILTPAQLAGRLAGGFLEVASRDSCHLLVRQALANLKFAELEQLREMPGAVKAISATLMKVWDADLDLKTLAARSPRISDLAQIEIYVRNHLPCGIMLQRELVSAAVANLKNAGSVLGSVTIRGFVFVAPCWQRLFLSLAGSTSIEWHSVETVKEHLTWIQGSAIRVVVGQTQRPREKSVVCATPKHEVIESLRWARELIVSGRARPHEIAIVGSATEDWDEDFRVLVADSQLPVHLVHGRGATSTFPGQQAASLATVLLEGLSHDRVVRSFRLLHNSAKLKSLPSDWYTDLDPDAPLLKLGHWKVSLDKLAENSERPDFRPTLLPILEMLSKGAPAAEQVGEELLSGQARAIWRRALLDGPPEALMTTVGQVRIPDESDPNANIVWGPAHDIASAPRRFTFMLGLTSRNWPRQGREDGLLPSHILDTAMLEPAWVTLKDRTHFAVLRDAASEIVYSRSRRDSEGRLLGTSPLALSELASQHLQRSRIPGHAFSESDRLLARRQEFSETERASSAVACYRDWRSLKITVHDGLLNSGHPVVEAAIMRAHSATSLRRMLTDPLGFVWRYSLGWKPPSPLSQEEPLALDKPAYGTLVHEVLRLTAASLESSGGFAAATQNQVESAIAESTDRVALDWELTKPLPPRLLWQRTLIEARNTALSALMWPLPKFKDQKTYVEVPFGGLGVDEDNAPWDRNALVAIPGSNLKLQGKIDRLDLDGKSINARVIDYKTGRCPDEEPGLDNGKELQRCLYAVAVKALLGQVTAVEAALLYPGSAGNLYSLSDPSVQTKELIGFLQLAEQMLRSGRSVFGMGAESRYNDMAFALPANAEGVYFSQKAAARDAMVGDLSRLWGEN